MSALPPPDHEARRERVREAVAAAGAERLWATSPISVRWLTGFTGTAGAVLVGTSADGDRLVTDDRYTARAGIEAPGIAVVATRDADAVALGEPGALGVEADHVTWARQQRLAERAGQSRVHLVATEQLIARLRTVKDAGEVARVREACALSVDAIGWLLDAHVRPGATERELAVALERRFVDLGAAAAAFPSIVASGPNGAVPHHAPTTRPLRAGELVTIDAGAVLDGYHADVTRTVAVGDPGTLLRDVHALVVAAQAAGRAAALAGIEAQDVDAAARGVVEAAGHGDAFVHGTGHGVGLEIHEAPLVAKGVRATLEAGMTLTVEPGVYLAGIGGVRVEDTVLIVADGAPTILTELPHELLVL